jgi:outer membrane protein assembly factor BamB
MRHLSALGLLAAAAPFALVAACHSSSEGPRASGPPVPPVDAGPPLPLAHGSPWPKFRSDAFQDGVGSVHAHTTGGAQWSVKTGKGIFSSPVVDADGTVFIGSADKNFYAVKPDGTVAWKIPCGELIDSAALLDDKGRLYFGAGDSKLRAVDPKTGNVIWTMTADDPSVNKAYINWFEGNVGIGLNGDLYVPNDNYFVYAVDRDTGTPKWKFTMPDQTWSLPAVDTANGGTLYIGNNNMVPLLGPNTYSISPDGGQLWSDSTTGTIAASPMLTAGGLVVLGAFDGYVYAYDHDGNVVWKFATRDHVYASAALLPDGTIVAASADGSVYGLDPKTGALRWQFDTPSPIRSSPSVDLDGNIYFGGGDGNLYVLGPDGKLRWSILLIDADRNDLNSSPALGADAIYLGGETGEIFSIPYEYCVRPEGMKDARCSTKPPVFADGAALMWTTTFGSLVATPPAAIDPTRPLTFSLVDRTTTGATLAILDSTKVTATTDPPTKVDVVVSGDGKFVTIVPETPFTPAADGTVAINISAPYLVNLTRKGLQLSGGTPGGTAQVSFKPTVNPAGTASLSLASTWSVTRLAVPLPSVMPSYNQIGFDSLWYMIGLVELSGNSAVAWMVGGQADDQGNASVDPATKAILPLTAAIDGGTVTLTAPGGITVQVTEISLPFASFRMDLQLDAQGQNPTGPASLFGGAICSDIPTYGTFLKTLGLCNPTTDGLSFVAGANVAYHGAQTAPAGVGTVAFSAASDGVTATLTGSSLQLSQHLASILLVDPTTGSPVTLGYALDSVRTAAADGTIATVKIPYNGKSHPANARAYLMIDTGAVANTTLALP